MWPRNRARMFAEKVSHGEEEGCKEVSKEGNDCQSEEGTSSCGSAQRCCQKSRCESEAPQKGDSPADARNRGEAGSGYSQAD